MPKEEGFMDYSIFLHKSSCASHLPSFKKEDKLGDFYLFLFYKFQNKIYYKDNIMCNILSKIDKREMKKRKE